MYIPPPMKMDNQQQVFDLIEQFSFGVIVSNIEGLEASHLPFMLDRGHGNKGRLLCHFAKANPQWKDLAEREVLVVFSGPHSYISPSWYANYPAVPTWNYSAVHVKGMVKISSKQDTAQLVKNMSAKYEPDLLDKHDIMSPEVIDKLSGAIIGLSIEISEIQGKFKLGQHRKIDDQQGVFKALSESDHNDAQQLARYMAALGIGTGETQR